MSHPAPSRVSLASLPSATTLGWLDVLLLPLGAVALVVVVLALALSFCFDGLLRLARAVPPLRWLLEGGAALVERVAAALAPRVLADKRDTPILALMLSTAFTVVPVFAVQVAVGRFDWRLALLFFLALYGPGFRQLVRAFSAKHNEAHRHHGFFAAPFHHFPGRYFEWFLGFFYGNCPELDRSAHVRMHHFENGGTRDPRNTIGYNHASVPHFLLYFSRSFISVLGLRAAAYFWRRKAWLPLRRMVTGILAFLAYEAALFAWDWRVGLFYGLVPFILLNFLVSLVEWTQHAFFDPEDVDNFYTSTSSVLYEGDYLFEGFHIAHHDHSSLHWTELPGHFERLRDKLARVDAIVFTGLDYIQFFLLLLTGRFETLADHYLDLGRNRSREEVLHLLRERTGALMARPAAPPSLAGELKPGV